MQDPPPGHTESSILRQTEGILQEYIQKKLSQYQIKDQIIAYVTSKEEKEQLLTFLREQFAKAQVPSKESEDILSFVAMAPLRRKVGARISHTFRATQGSGLTQRISDKPEILIIDGDTETRAAMRAALEGHRWRLSFAGTGEEAESCIGATPPVVAILDPNLPGYDGLRILGRLRRLKPVPGVILTGSQGALEQEFEVVAYPRKEFIKKPIIGATMYAAVMRLVEPKERKT